MTDDRQKQLTEAFVKAFGEASDAVPHFEVAAPTVHHVTEVLRRHQAEIVRRQDEAILNFLESIPEKKWGWVRAIHYLDQHAHLDIAMRSFISELVKPRTLSERWRSRKQRKAIAAHVAELREDHR